MYEHQHPIYLHFLDRELGSSVDFHATPLLVERVLKILALTCSAACYCGISLIWENPALNADCRRFIALLEESDVLGAVSYNGTVEEFYESRQRLYAHDAQRYPLYFSGGPDGLRTIRATLHKPQDTTSALLKDLGLWMSEPSSPSRDNITAPALQATEDGLQARTDEAVTYRLFHPFLAKVGGTPADTGVISRQISLAYSRHYLDYADGDILTGIKGLSFFDDQLATAFPLHDVPLLLLLLDTAGLSPLIEQPWPTRRAFWDPFLAELRNADGYNLSTTVRTILQAAHNQLPPSVHAHSQYAARTRIAALIKQARHNLETKLPRPYGSWRDSNTHIGEHSTKPLLVHARTSLEALAQALHRSDVYRELPQVERKGDAVTAAITSDPHPATRLPRILLLTATQVETKCALETFAQTLGPRKKPLFGEHTTYFSLGQAHGCDVYLAQSEAGAAGPSGSILTAHDAFRFLDPVLVIMLGIAFGAKPTEQQIGDILISRQVVAYENQRISGPGSPQQLIPRGDRVSASPRLLDRCRTVGIDWTPSAVHFGLMLSGDKLIDNADYLDQLASQFGHDAVGGEMEGAGLYAAAYRQRKEWIIIKAISDWADGTKHERKTERQQLAATRASQFTADLITSGGLAPPPPSSRSD
ncbi:hypothetical protein ACJWDR_44625 [Streptomyces tauricus]|uniref:5'-methylthioadenosine/S-adenosylhomocysteine nucleosidase family protein n=1 Tax=Streptomyces tauricus TaxID=68274 RepID=UPI00387EFD73